MQAVSAHTRSANVYIATWSTCWELSSQAQSTGKGDLGMRCLLLTFKIQKQSAQNSDKCTSISINEGRNGDCIEASCRGCRCWRIASRNSPVLVIANQRGDWIKAGIVKLTDKLLSSEMKPIRRNNVSFQF